MKKFFAKLLGKPPTRALYPKNSHPALPVWEFIPGENTTLARIYYTAGHIEEQIFTDVKKAYRWVHDEIAKETA